MKENKIKTNEFALLNFKRDHSGGDEEGTLTFQKITFYEMNEDGTYENGTTIENVLEVAKGRLEQLNEKFSCRENALAITKIQEAIMWLEARTKNRLERGVEGKHLL